MAAVDVVGGGRARADAAVGRRRLGDRRALTGLRGGAIAIVVLRHLDIGAGYGVDVFIVLSGFLLTTVLLEEHAATGAIDVRRFVSRRFVRLHPLLLVVVLATVGVFLVAVPDSGGDAVAGGVLALTYLANVARVLGTMPTLPFEHTWSLALTEQVALIWPFVVGGIARVARGRAGVLAAAVLAMVGVSLAVEAALVVGGHHELVFATLGGRAVPLLLGALVAAVVHGEVLDVRSTRVQRWSGAVAVGALALMVLHSARRPFGDEPPMVVSVLDGPFTGALAALLTLALVAAPTSVVARALAHRSAVGLGRASYSLYLWHVPVIWLVAARTEGGWVRRPLALVASLAVAAASWRFVEQPILRWRDRRGAGARATAMVIDLRDASVPARVPEVASRDDVAKVG